MSADSWALAARKYLFDFTTTEDSVVRCADDLASYVGDVALPWFARFGSPEAALATQGPLTEAARIRLRLALGGQHDEVAIAASRAMLGLSA